MRRLHRQVQSRLDAVISEVRHGLPTARLIWTVIDCSAFGARLTGILSRVLVARFDSGGCLDIVDGGCSCAIEVVYECRLRCVGGCSHGLKYCPDVVAAAV